MMLLAELTELDCLLVEEKVVDTTAVFKALSDPTRLRIFAELLAGDSCNGELKEILGLAPNLLSHHLKALESAGLIESRRDVLDARWVYYSVNHDHLAAWHQWLTLFFDPARIQTRPLCGPEGQCNG